MTASLLDTFRANVPDKLDASIQRLLERPREAPHELVEQLDLYSARIDAAARVRHDLDVHLADSIFRSCRSLLQDGWDHLGAEEQRLIQLACEYYLDPDDEDGDLDSVFGFDDDAEILNLVLETIGRLELQVRI